MLSFGSLAVTTVSPPGFRVGGGKEVYCLLMSEASAFSQRVRARWIAAKAATRGTDTHGLAVKNNEDGASRIRGLRCRVGPSTVFWRVVPVYLDAIERHTGRRLSHVIEECLEGPEASILAISDAWKLPRHRSQTPIPLPP